MNFANSCAPSVQPQFQQAVAMLHSFWYDEAGRQFQSVANTDSQCAIAWWGVAMTKWHPLWEPRGPGKGEMDIGANAIQKANSISATTKITERERQFIAALGAFYGDYAKIDHTDRVLAYEKKMEVLHEAYPADEEATVFYALALLGSAGSLSPDKTHTRQKKAGALLEPIFAADPNHPGAAHMIIHAYDYPDLAERALPAARAYAKIAPESAHALHMPSHIFTRLGLWQESIDSNLASAEAAHKYHLPGDELHAKDYLVFAYLQTGQDAKAHEVFHDNRLPDDADMSRFQGIFSAVAMPARYALERRQWAEAAALPESSGLPVGRYAWANATVYYARALGALRTGKTDQARQEIAKLEAEHKTLSDLKEDYWANQVAIQKAIASAWLSFAEGKQSEGIQQMRAAVALDDAADKHPVTPGSIIPPRDLLGQMLIETKQPAEALAEYEKLLVREPNRFAALYGIGYSAQLAGQTEKAREAYSKLIRMTQSDERVQVREARAFLTSQDRKQADGQ
ncbi:MAG TPA: hypothetical protein VG897_01470 [Terriglobales bacterium]|nr:hypothetical protein [Terriglobales bacterium]